MVGEKKKRGFGGMSPEKQREIASKGGRAAHAKGSAHKFSHDDAVAAGRKGGKNNVNRHRFTSEEAREAGKKGGRKKKPPTETEQ